MLGHRVIAEQELARYWGIVARYADRRVLPTVDGARHRAARWIASVDNRAARRTLRLTVGAVVLASMPGDYGFIPWDVPVGIFDDLFGWVGVGLDWLRNWIFSAIGKAIGFALDMVRTLQATLHPLFDSVFGTFEWILDRVESVASIALNLAATVANDIAQAVNGVFGIVADMISAAIAAVYQSLQPIIEGLIRAALNVVETVWSGIIGAVQASINGLIGFVNDVIVTNLNQLWDAIGRLTDFAWGTFWEIFWPQLANQLGVPEDPIDVLRGAWWFLKLARDFASGDFRDSMEAFASGAYGYATGRVADMAMEQWDGLEPIIRAAVGLPL